MKEFIEKIEILISQNKVELAINNLIDLLKNQDKELYNSILMLSSRNIEIETTYNVKNLISLDDYQKEKSKIKYAILTLIGQITNNENSNKSDEKLKENELNEIRNLLILFERAAFYPNSLNSPDSAAKLFKALQETRIALQIKGATLLRNKTVANYFGKIRDILLAIENDVIQKYPKIINEIQSNSVNFGENDLAVKKELVDKMRSIDEIRDLVDRIKRYLWNE